MFNKERDIPAQTIRVVLADQRDDLTLAERIELTFSLASLKSPTDPKRPLDLANHFVGEAQASALLRAKEILDAKIRELRDAARKALET